ncbi:MAG: branched-chain amino acid ABC transporter permease [Actinomycetota bacterium]
MMFSILAFGQAGGQDAAEKFANATSSGIALGAIYALLALGLVLIYKATQVLNFAHGALAALGAFFAAYVATVLNFPGRYATFLPETMQWVLSALVAVLLTAVVGLVLERLAIRPMIGEPLFSVVMITIALDIVIRTITNDLIGANPRPMGDPWGADVINIGPAVVAKTEIATVIVTIITLIGIAMFFRSRYGVAMRATAFDQEAAMAQGISAGRIFAMAWAIGAALAALAGIFSSLFPRSAIGVSSTTAFFAFRALPAIVIGGLDSITGAVVGGFIVGLAESYAGAYLIGETWSFLGLGFSGVMPYIVMLVVLLIRPYGLFGTEEIRRV